MGNVMNVSSVIFNEAVKLIEQHGVLTLDQLFEHLLPLLPNVSAELTRERLLQNRGNVIGAFEVMAKFSITRDYPDYEYDETTRTIRLRRQLKGDLDWKNVHDTQFSPIY